jgi:hypothetical protein
LLNPGGLYGKGGAVGAESERSGYAALKSSTILVIESDLGGNGEADGSTFAVDKDG